MRYSPGRSFRGFCVFAVALMSSTSVHAQSYPQQVPCPGLAVEVQMLNGAPALFRDGQPITGLMASPNVEWGTGSYPVVANGKLTLTNNPGYYSYRTLETTDTYGPSEGEVSADVAIEEITAATGSCNLTLRVHSDASNAYMVTLKRQSDGSRTANFWKQQAGAYLEWFSIPFAWQTGQYYTLTLSKSGNEFSAYVDDQLIGQTTDGSPLPAGKVAFSAYHVKGDVDLVQATQVVAPQTIFYEDFSEARPWFWNGQPLEPASTFAQAGVHICNGISWSSDKWKGWCPAAGTYDYSQIDNAYNSRLAQDPDALFCPRIDTRPPDWWMAAHPEEASILSWIGGGESAESFPSFTSQLWIDDASEMLRQYIRHVNSSPYGDRFIGCILGGGSALEWVYNWGPYWHDYSDNQRNAFRAWLGETYPDLDALRTAWDDPSVTFETAEIPSPAARETGDYFEFYDPAAGGRQVSDYMRYHSIAVSDALMQLAQVVKEETQDKRIVITFYGYHLNASVENNHHRTYMNQGHRDLARVLECPHVDGLGTIPTYRDREPGGVTQPSTPVNSALLNGKLVFCEDDIRTHLAADTDLNNNEGRAQNLDESINIIKRDFGYCLSKNLPFWWMDWGNGWYSKQALMDVIEKVQDIAAMPITAGWDRSTNADIAIIVSDESIEYLRTSTSLIGPLLDEQVFYHCSHIGAPYDTYLIDDLATIPEYKMYIFLDTLYLTDAQKQTIQDHVLKDNHTVIWAYAPGYVTEDSLSVSSVSQLTGIQLTAAAMSAECSLTIDNTTHEITSDLDPGCQWAVSDGAYGPIFYSTDAQATVLGNLHAPGLDQPGFVIKDMSGWTSIWCGVPGIPADVLRQIAKYAGAHVYVDASDAVYANRFMVSVHTDTAGQRTVSLPVTANVVDPFTSTTVATQVSQFSTTLNAKETGFWLLEDIAPTLSVSPDSRSVDSSAGSTTFSVSNLGSGDMSWTAQVTGGTYWLSITSGASGVNDGTIVVEYDAKQSGGSRTGTIRVTAGGAQGSPKDITILQQGAAAQELLLNGGFEEGESGLPYGDGFSDSFPVTAPSSLDHWGTDTGISGRWYGAYMNHTPGGNRCIGTWGQYTYAYQAVNIAGDTEYTLSAYCRPLLPAWPEGVGGILEVIWFDFPDPNMNDYADKISRQTVATFVPGEVDYEIWHEISGTTTSPAQAQSALVLIGNKDGTGWTSAIWDDVSLMEALPTPPANCAEVHSRGYGLAADLNQDCYVNSWADLAIFASQWLMCNDPQRFDEPECEPTW